MLQREVHITIDTDSTLLQMNASQYGLSGQYVFEGSEYREGFVQSITRT